VGWKATPEHTQTLKTCDCPILIKQKNQRKKEASVEVGTDYEHQRAKDYLTLQQNPLTIPCVILFLDICVILFLFKTRLRDWILLALSTETN
jgi:hypothetical protein